MGEGRPPPPPGGEPYSPRPREFPAGLRINLIVILAITSPIFIPRNFWYRFLPCPGSLWRSLWESVVFQ